MAPARVAILGGGLAGMAAALRLSEAGYETTLIEKRQVLGGRASSFTPPGELESIDNCQHVLMGCCTNLLDFFRRAGVADNFRFYSRYLFENHGAVFSLSAAALPAPLHFLPSLAGFRSFTWQDRWSIARAMLAILRTPQPFPDEPLENWLSRHRQSETVRENFWKVILVSALNEELDRISTTAAFHVFLDGFLRNRRGYRMGVPTVPLEELYRSQTLREKCELRLGSLLTTMETAAGRVESLRVQNQEPVQADFYISALTPDALAGLLPSEQAGSEELRRWAGLEWSPITGIHLWFDRAVMDLDHLTVCGKTIQWIFNKSAIARSREEGSQYLQLVVSASRSLVMMKREAILELALGELGEILPRSKQATLRRAVVVKETEATPSIPPGADASRPTADSGKSFLGLSNVFLAGDWTATGWPPTMEGAVRSGYLAAEQVTRAAGRPQCFLVPDLPADPLTRLLLPS